MLRDDSKDDILNIYEVQLIPPTGDTSGINLLSSVYAAVRVTDDAQFLAEYPAAKAVMIPQAVLYKASIRPIPDPASNDLGAAV